MKQYHLPVKGMTCASCVARVEKLANKFDGIDDVSVNFANEKLSFKVKDDSFNLDDLKKLVHNYGYEIEDEPDSNEKNKNQNVIDFEEDAHYKKLKNDFITALIFTIPVFTISMLIDFEFFRSFWTISRDYTNKILFLLTTPVIFISGQRFYVIFWKNIKKFNAEMNSLVAIGTAAAYGFSTVAALFPELIHSTGTAPHVYFETAAVIITLILFGRMLEHNAKRKTNASIKKLMELQPSKVIIYENGEEKEIKLSALQVGMNVVIKPGSKIPADGKIVNGGSSVDESMITGESMPVIKNENSEVYAGTINKSGSFIFTVTQAGDNSVLGQIIKMVEEAQGSKAPIQNLADKIASVFTPSVIAAAFITFVVWAFFIPGTGFDTALIHSVAVLIIACPCALGLATPTAIMAGTGLGAKFGILIKNGETLEKAYKITDVVFDKTGTITEGSPTVSEFAADENFKEILLKSAYSLEMKSEHIFAKAIIDYAKNKNINAAEVTDFEALHGSGVKGKVDGIEVFVISVEFAADNKLIDKQTEEKAISYSENGKTPVIVYVENTGTGIFAIADPVKKDAKETIEKIKKAGINVIILTGDNKKTAEAIASEAGITEVFAGVKPNEKADKIKELQKSNKIVAMVGDGINDAPALTVADVGIAIGAGTDVAIESSDITLTGNSLKTVFTAVNLSGKTIRVIKQNLFWAFIYNVIGIPLAAFGILNPMFAALAMSMSSVSVVSNSLRLSRFKIK